MFSQWETVEDIYIYIQTIQDTVDSTDKVICTKITKWRGSMFLKKLNKFCISLKGISMSVNKLPTVEKSII